MPRFLISPFAVVLALGVGVAVAGCGGEGGGEPLSDEEFVAAFVEACTGYSESIDGIAEGFDTDIDTPEAFRESYTQTFEQLVPAFKTLTADIEQIEPPAADAEEYDELVGKLGELTSLYEDNLDLLADEAVAIAGGAEESEAGLALDERFTEVSGELETLALGLDLPTDCADPVSESGGSTVPEP